LLEDGGRLERMAQRMKSLATPHAAGEVAEKLLRARAKE
jgi:UDP-N-acetylglucosamine:LPS N-acetylglucosamine transferase